VAPTPRSDRVRAVRSLARRSVRERQGLFLAEGPQAVREALRFAPDLVRDLYVTDQAADRYAADLATAPDVRVHRVADDVLAAMADAQTPQGLLAVCRTPAADLDAVLAGSPRLVAVLAHVRDPGNAGTVIRAADAAGAGAVVVSDGSVDVYAPKTVRSTAGSLFHLPVVTGVPVADAVARLRSSGLAVLAADGAGERTVDDVDLVGPHAWLFGNEAWGLEPEERALADDVVRVPIHGRAESLNLAMAATVCLYASARQQRPPTSAGR
jgi:TrmH family RNA methyltransferase